MFSKTTPNQPIIITEPTTHNNSTTMQTTKQK